MYVTRPRPACPGGGENLTLIVAILNYANY